MGSTATAVSKKVDVFDAIPEAPKGKSGSKTPVVDISAEMEAKLKERADLAKAIDDAGEYLKAIDAALKPECEKMRRDLSTQQSRHVSSISLGGLKLYECQNKYSGVPLSEEAALRKMFNGSFDEWFATKTQLKVDADKFRELAESEPAVAEALQLLISKGAVLATRVLKPTEKLHFARSTDPSVGLLMDAAAKEYSGLKPTMFFTK